MNFSDSEPLSRVIRVFLVRGATSPFRSFRSPRLAHAAEPRLDGRLIRPESLDVGEAALAG